MACGVLRCNQSTRDRKQRERFSPTERMEWQRRRYSREAAYDATANRRRDGCGERTALLLFVLLVVVLFLTILILTVVDDNPCDCSGFACPWHVGCRPGRCGAACVHTADVVTSISPPSTPFNLLSFAQLPFGPPRQDLEPGPW